MLSEFTPVVTLPTADLSRARSFYEGTLGFAPGDEAMVGVIYKCGDSAFFVYESEYAGTNQATAMNINVPLSAFDAEIGALREKGVTFQTFEAEGLDWNDGVASVGDAMKAVWFTDHDGNIINVSAGEM
jgi:catechol 2,3-dioxygenase-like lactoylglutathione lyase family enzyme